MNKISMTMTSMMMITMMMFWITTMISKKTKMSREKNSPFECGFSPMSSARKPFSIQFFMIALLFIVFDIEISLILPIYSTKLTNMKEWMLSSTITMMILMTGLYHEWKNGILEWSK